MTARTTLALPLPFVADEESRTARRRFAALMRELRALATRASAMRPRTPTTDRGVAVDDLPDEPTRRTNRIRRLFGRINKRPLQGGKSRSTAR